MKFNILLILIFIFYSVGLKAQKLSLTDSLTFKITCSNCSVSDLHKKLVTDKKTDHEKIRAFYVWIAYNINYDTRLFFSQDPNPDTQEPGKIMQSRKAVCQGYSELFRELCSLSNIRCYVVNGYNKSDGRFIGSGHSWNIAYINDNWKLFDVTWGAGVVSNDRKYIRSFSENYFMPDPLNFLNDHYPLDPMWQLVNNPVILKDFKNERWKPASILKDGNFNFNDTIAEWESADALSRKVISGKRMVRFNPGDQIAAQYLTLAQLDQANTYFGYGNTILDTLFPSSKNKPVPISETDNVIAKLDSVMNFYLQAESLYKNIKPQSPDEMSLLKNNMKALENNKELIRQQRALLLNETR